MANTASSGKIFQTRLDVALHIRMNKLERHLNVNEPIVDIVNTNWQGCRQKSEDLHTFRHFISIFIQVHLYIQFGRASLNGVLI